MDVNDINNDVHVTNKAFTDVFSSPQGELVLHNICRFCHLTRATFSREIGSSMDMAFKEGERNVALYILNRLNSSPLDIIEDIINND